MPDLAARREVEKGRLKKLSWAGKAFPICARIYVHKDKHVSMAIRELADMIAENEA